MAFSVFWLSCGVFVTLSCTRGDDRPRPQTVVLVTVDTLRADFLPFADTAPRVAPFLDQLASRGVVFTEAYAPSSWTSPSMASLFTSLAPSSHGVVSEGLRGEAQVPQQEMLPSSLTTLAELFQAAGYLTIGVAANRHLGSRVGFAQGFDFYYAKADFIDAPKVNEEVVSLLEKAFGLQWKSEWKRRKTFLWIHYFDPHDPYFARKPWIHDYAPGFDADPSAFPKGMVMRKMRAEFQPPTADLAARIASLYRAEISFLDQQIGRLAERLGLADDDVLFVFASDHGEEMVEHGGLGHARTLYEEVLRIPLFLTWPAALPGGSRIDRPVTLLDVYPTLADIAGLKPPERLHGRSLLPALRGKVPVPSDPLFFELHVPRFARKAIRRDRWKLIRNDVSGKAELFDIVSDPGETIDLADKHPEIVGSLRAALSRWTDALPEPPADLRRTGIPEDAREQLRALGYLD